MLFWLSTSTERLKDSNHHAWWVEKHVGQTGSIVAEDGVLYVMRLADRSSGRSPRR